MSAPIPLRRDISRVPGTISRRVSGAVLVLGPDNEDPTLLDGAAAVVWERLALPQDADQLADDLSREVDSDEISVHETVVSVVDQLRQLGLVRVQP